MKKTLLLFLIAGLAGCVKNADYNKLSLNFVVATNGDKEANFSQYEFLGVNSLNNFGIQLGIAWNNF